MPAKSLCPKCGGTLRSPNHVCIPSAVGKRETRRKAIADLTNPSQQ